MRRQAIATRKAPEAIGPYSQAVAADPWVFLSGQIGLYPATGALAAGGVREQADQALKNLGAVLEAAGVGFEHVVKTTVYLLDLSKFSEMNEVYGRYFGAPAPARATVQVSGLPRGALVQIEAVAVRP